MNPKHKRLLIVIGMVIVTLIGCKYLTVNSEPDPQSQGLTPVPVEKNVPTNSNTLWDQRLYNVVQIYSKDKDGNVMSVGTGWFVKDQPGLIMTDDHVLSKDAAKFQINLKDGRTYETDDIVWSSKKDDLAKIYIKTIDKLPDGLSVCNRNPEIAEDVWLIGSPFNMPWSVHKGIIASPSRSNVPRFKELGFTSDYMEIDMSMVPGMSGGPLITKDNCVIGMASFIYATKIDDDGPMQTLSYASRNDRIIAAINAKK